MFKFELLEQSTKVDTNGARTYHSALALRPWITDPLCESTSDGTFRLEFVGSVGYRNDGGLGHFTVFRPGETAAALTTTAWNYERDNPCDSGSSRGSAACVKVANALLYRTLAQVAYTSFQQIPTKDRTRAKLQFNPARFAAETLHFCVEREANSGGGSWPYVWGLSCQTERMRTKLAQFYAWRACTTRKIDKCAFPDELFDKSKSDVEK